MLLAWRQPREQIAAFDKVTNPCVRLLVCRAGDEEGPSRWPVAPQMKDSPHPALPSRTHGAALRGESAAISSALDTRRSGARVRLSSIISSAADLLWDWPCEMNEAQVERRLAAILAVDVAGYSRLMGSDEEGTLAAPRAVRRELSN